MIQNLDQETIKEILTELELSLEKTKNECRVFHKTFAESDDEITRSWEDMESTEEILFDISEINKETISIEELLLVIKNSIQLLNNIESNPMYY